MKNIVCLISGRGSNLEAILNAQRDRDWKTTLDAQVTAVISNRADARGLAIAQARGVHTHVVPHDTYDSRAAFDAALAVCIDEHRPDLIVLAGFLRVLTPEFVERYGDRLINIHPSLLPAFLGLGTHARAIEAGVRIHGTTVHFVSGELDSGPIIAQAALAVYPGESEAELARRVLALEHRLLPACIEWILQGRVRSDGRRVHSGSLGPDELLMREP